MKKIMIITAIVGLAGMFIGCGSQVDLSNEWFLDESKITVKVSPCELEIEEPVIPTVLCRLLPGSDDECPELMQEPVDQDGGMWMGKMTATDGGPGGTGYFVSLLRTTGGPGGTGSPYAFISFDTSNDCFIYEIEAIDGATNPDALLTIMVDTEIALNADGNGAFKLSLEINGLFDTTVNLVDPETGSTLKSITKAY